MLLQLPLYIRGHVGFPRCSCSKRADFCNIFIVQVLCVVGAKLPFSRRQTATVCQHSTTNKALVLHFNAISRVYYGESIYRGVLLLRLNCHLNGCSRGSTPCRLFLVHNTCFVPSLFFIQLYGKKIPKECERHNFFLSLSLRNCRTFCDILSAAVWMVDLFTLHLNHLHLVLNLLFSCIRQ